MFAIQVKEMGVKFLLRHQKTNTLLETIIKLFARRRNERPSAISGNQDFWALRSITFSVKEGESLGVIGRNGAGKSTLLQILLGIYKPDEGAVEKRGTAGLLQVGTGFHPDLTGHENIYLNGAILGLKKREIDSIYDSIVDFSELGHFIDTPTKNYSSGMTARLGFSIAINIKPDILMIDEVLSVGDEEFRKKSRQKLEEIREMGKTIMLVSHSLNDVKKICERAICLDKGQIVYEGKSAEVAEFYQDLVSKEETKKPNK
jgi:ABC-2 type transport system ATP-binding protein